ncbi:MAG: glycosyltransferase family 4 protein [Gemmatimonadaceae bacterium]|nr:glycosyltransferase family 4 protein [Chitinophagaceae bacterium]
MKVISLVPYKIFPAVTGGQKNIAIFNEYLSKQCSLVCVTVKSNLPSGASYPVMNCIGDGASRYINPFNFFLLRRIIRQQQATHLIIEHPYWGWLGMLLKWSTGIHLTVHSHNIESTRWKSLGKWWWSIMAWYEGMTHRNADASLFITAEDRDFAVSRYGVDARKCAVINYGINREVAPDESERKSSRSILMDKHIITPDEKIILFNGTLSYFPNIEAVDFIVKKINPLLISSGLKYRMLICGGGLPAEYGCLKDIQNLSYAGFVDDIGVYFMGADLFINPVNSGGGLKTKLVEAIGYGLSGVSTRNGAMGVPPEVAGSKLKIVENEDWAGFTSAIQAALNEEGNLTPGAFYQYFLWKNIVKRAVEHISVNHER